MKAGTLIVSDFMGNGTAGGVSFRDVGSGFTVTWPYCAPPMFPNYFGFSNDIIVGNDATLPLTDFRVAAVYVNNLTGFPQIDFFLVHYTGPGVFVVSVLGSTPFSPAWATNTIHIDIISEAANTLATGFPWCNKYVVTWDDAITGKCFAYYGALNGPIPPPMVPAMTVPLLNFTGIGNAPDVAAIQRTVGLSVDDIGLFVTVEGNAICYQEWDFGPGFIGPLTPLANPISAAYAAGINWPRIDAPDDFNINSPATPGLSYFKIVAQVSPAAGVYWSHTFDNQTGVGQDDGWYLQPPPSQPWSPTVAYGGNNGTQYQVLHYQDAVATSPGPLPNIYMEPINWMAPGQMAVNIPDWVGLIQPYFRVNLGAINFANGNYINSISTPCNNPSSKTLCAWSDLLPMPVNQSQVYYKISGYGPPVGYAFKHSAPAQSASVASWKVYPSPANNELTLETTLDGKYEVHDVLGRTVLSGELQAGKQTIDIASLAPGNYIISAFKDGEQKDHSSFVKQ